MYSKVVKNSYLAEECRDVTFGQVNKSDVDSLTLRANCKLTKCLDVYT